MSKGTLFLTGSVPASGDTIAYVKGIASSVGDMPLKIGATRSSTFRTLSVPEVLGFRCDGMGLFTPTPLGSRVNSALDLQFAGGSGVTQGIDLNIGNVSATGALNLAIGQPAPNNANMNIAFSGVHGAVNSIPCAEGNLRTFGANILNNNMTLHINRNSATGAPPLYMGSPDPVNADMPLVLNTEFFGSGIDLDQHGHALASSNTTLFLNDRNMSEDLDLFMQAPEPAVADTTLYASGSIAPSANSLSNNFSHQSLPSLSTAPFDTSTSAEAVISPTNSNSISRNKLLGSSMDYGYRRISSIGSTIAQYSGFYADSFYENETSRTSIDSNGTYLAIGSNTSVLSTQYALQIFEVVNSSSVKLKYTYDNFLEELKAVGVINSDENFIKIFYKDVKISPAHKIAVSIRVEVSSSYKDIVCILEPSTITTSTVSSDITDICALNPIVTKEIITSSVDGWKLTKAVSSKSWTADTRLDEKLNIIMGTSVAWNGEDLYFDKQSNRYASVKVMLASDSYSGYTTAFSFSDTSDGTGYYDNRYNLPEGTKVGFGSRIIVSGDLAFVSAPLMDNYVANNTLSATNASSPNGAVYIFKNDGGWSNTDSVYAGGFTSANIAGEGSCGYEPKLFGYDIDYDSVSEFLSVGEPVSKKAYQFVVDSDGTPRLDKSYTSTSNRFGSFVSSSSSSLFTNTASEVQDPRNSSSTSYSSSNISSEIEQYIAGEKVSSSTETITMCKKFDLLGSAVLLVGRDFSATYALGKKVTIQKISLMNLSDLSGTLMLQGPLQSTGIVDLSMETFGTANNDMSVTFAAYGVTGATTLYMASPGGSTGIIPLHMRASTELEFPLFITAERRPSSGILTAYMSGPSGLTGAMNLMAEPHAAATKQADLSLLGAVGNSEQLGFDLFLPQVDIFDASGQQNLQIANAIGPGTGNITGLRSLYLGAGDFGPASGITTAVMKGPEFVVGSGDMDILLRVDEPSGTDAKANDLMLQNTQTSIPRDSLVGGIITRKGLDIVMNAAGPANSGVDLVLYRKGLSGGQEIEKTMNMSLTNITVSSNVNVYTSGANIVNGDMNVAISGVFGAINKDASLYTKGYQL